MLVILTTAASYAQNIQNQEDTVDKSFRSDSRVDPVTLGMNMNIPLGSYAGRAGTSVPVYISYSSKMWKMQYGGHYQDEISSENYSWVVARYADDSGAGWRGGMRFPELDGSAADAYDLNGNPAEYAPNQTYTVDRIRLRLSDGETVELRKDDKVALMTGAAPLYPVVYYSVDGSKLKYVKESQATATLYLPDGSRYLWKPEREYIDRYGNKLLYNTSNQWTDTLGRVVSVPTPYNRSQPADETHALPSLSNTSRSYTLRWRHLKDPQTQVSVLSDPNQQLHVVGNSFSHGPVPDPSITASSLFYYDSGTRVTDPSLFNPVVLAEVELPNGSKYQFRYNVYGEIDKVIYPTGGYERFEYAPVPNVDPLNEPYTQANRGVVKRWVSPSGAGNDEQLWQYSNSYIANNGYKATTTAPDGTRTERFIQKGRSPGVIKYGFDDVRSGRIIEEKIYSSVNQLMSRTLYDYVMEGARGAQAHPTATRDARIKKSVSVVFEPNSASALVTMRENEYDAHADLEYFAYLNVRQAKEYNYISIGAQTGQTAHINTLAGYFSPQNLARASETDYLYDANYKARNILTLPTETRVKDASGNVKAASQILYDEAIYPVINVGTAIQWQDPQTSVRGNATTSKAWDSSTGGWLQTHAQYDNFGNLRKNWDAKGKLSEMEYSSAYSFAYPTKVTTPAPDSSGQSGSSVPFETTTTYDLPTGLPLTTTDYNGQVTQMEYNDSLLRPTRVNPPAGGAVQEMIYNDTPGNLWVKTRSQVDGVNWAESIMYADGLGRTKVAQKKDNQGDVFTETEYDQIGRLKRVTNPFRNGETKLWTESFYDGLGRVTKLKTPDNAEINMVFDVAGSGNLGIVVTVIDQAGKQRRSITDALGQLVRVDEPDDLGNLGATGSPVQWTGYSYDTLGNLTTVNQGGQTRIFGYDSLSRLRQAANPESGTINYNYDNNGNLVQKTDARNVTTTYTYDALNRALSRSYSDGTPQVNYTYDDSAIQYAKGKLTKVSSSISETRYTQFDNLGRVLSSSQITDGNTYNFAYQYNLAGMLVSETYPSGRVVSNQIDADGDLAQVNGSFGGMNKTYAANFSYTAAGAISSMQLGNGRWENAVFNSRLQPVQIGLGTSANAQELWKVNYDYGTTNNNGNVLSQQITIQNQFQATQNYSYDSLNRLKSANETVNSQMSWQQVFNYDRYGNRQFDVSNTTTLGSCPQNQCNPTVDAANNRFTTNQGYTYDLSGNLITDAQNRTFYYDAENKQKEVRDAQNQIVGQYLYDGDGKRVKKISSQETTIFVYDGGGKLAAEYTVTTTTPQAPTTSYLTIDTLGSPRVITDQAGNVQSRRDFMPFGEEIAGLGGRNQSLGYQADNTRQKFTSYERDNESGLDFAQARMYNYQHGRFTAVDPLLVSANPTNPQSWNRYIYCFNNPLIFVDPTGEMGDYYDRDNGTYLGSDGIDDDKVYSAKEKSRTERDGKIHRELVNVNLLPITHTEFQIASNIVRQEGATDDTNEYLWIAHASNNRASATNNSLYGLLMTTYSSVEKSKKTALSTGDDSLRANAARAGVIDALSGGADPTSGAQFWDGTDFLARGRNHPKFSQYDSIVIREDVFNNHLSSQGGNSTRLKGQRYALPNPFFSRNQGSWTRDGVSESGFRYSRNNGRGVLYATGAAGKSIFWSVNYKWDK